jgi:hypothetical protein
MWRTNERDKKIRKRNIKNATILQLLWTINKIKRQKYLYFIFQKKRKEETIYLLINIIILVVLHCLVVDEQFDRKFKKKRNYD